MSGTTSGNKKKTPQSAYALLIGSALVLGLNYCAFRLHLNLSAASSISLLLIVMTALRFGFWPASGASVVAAICLDYFFTSPILSFQITDPQNWIALASFEFTALVISRLSIQVQDHMKKAVLHRRDAERLYELSHSLLTLNRQHPPGPQIVELIIRHIDLDSTAIFDSTFARSDCAGGHHIENQQRVRDAYLTNVSHDDHESREWLRILHTGSRPIGAIVLCGGNLNPIMVDAITSLVATALERFRSFEKESHAEAIRYAEQLRKTILDGLAHAFKTPLTVIHASASGLLEMNHLNQTQTELVELIHGQSTHLDGMTNRFFRMAKLESTEVQLRIDHVSVPQLIEEILDHSSEQLFGHPVQVCIADRNLQIRADRELVAVTIRELLLNAAKYSKPNSSILLSANRQNDQVVIAVHNDDSLIAPEEKELIFEQFYRSPTTKHRAPGSGIGLAIAKKTVTAHRGQIWVNSEQETGTTFFLSFPALGRSAHESVAN
jgi:two-component system, OmpR family, sensor histidine kinase KdpD